MAAVLVEQSIWLLHAIFDLPQMMLFFCIQEINIGMAAEVGHFSDCQNNTGFKNERKWHIQEEECMPKKPKKLD
jgi:hypothetical protein